MASEAQPLLYQSREILEMILEHFDEESSKQAALICKRFHDLICYLRKDKPQCLDLSEKHVTNDTIFGSIMSSKRHVNQISIKMKSETADTEKCAAIIEKFSRHLKKLKIAYMYPLRILPWELYLDKWKTSMTDFFRLIGGASEVEELSLDIKVAFGRSSKRRRVELKTFSKLKRLQLFERTPEELLCAIPDDSLEELTINFYCGDETSVMQTFVNRQKKIKKLSIDPSNSINIDHLVLDELTYWLTGQYKEEIASAAFFINQPGLRSLSVGEVNDAYFARICQMRDLETLNVNITVLEDNASIALMNNLKNLKSLDMQDSTESEIPFFYQLLLPKLQELKCSYLNLDPELFNDLALGMSNLEEFCIDCCGISILPRVIENFRALKTLSVHQISTITREIPAPSRQNESIEKLVLHTRNYPASAFTEVINACPNLKHLVVCVTDGFDAGLLACIQRQTELTSFLFADYTENQLLPDAVEVNISLLGLINHFRDTPNFVKLELAYKLELEKIPFKDLLGADNVAIDTEASFDRRHLVRLVKKSKV